MSEQVVTSESGYRRSFTWFVKSVSTLAYEKENNNIHFCPHAVTGSSPLMIE